MHQAADSLGLYVVARAPRRLFALWCANQRLRPVQAPRTAAGVGAAADRPPLDAPRSVGSLGSAVGSKFEVVQRPSLAVVCKGPVPSKRRCEHREVRHGFAASRPPGAPSHNRSVNRTPKSCAFGFPPLRSGAGYVQR
jgi:hypothetical protein